MKSPIGALASWANVTCSFAAFGLGLTIMAKGGSAGADAITVGAPLLLTGEALKLLIGGSLAIQVSAFARVTGGWLPRLAGFSSALLMVAAGAMGVAAILDPRFRPLASFVNPVALGSVVASGLWSLTSILAGRKDRRMPLWMVVVGALLPLPGVAALFVPAAGLAAFVLGVLWNIGVGIALSKRQP